PLGTVTAHPTGGYAKSIVHARDAELVATIVHTSPISSAGRMAIFDRSGKEIASSAARAGINGYAWAPDDREVWFSAWTGEDETNGIYALGVDGRERELVHTESAVVLQDVAADGRLLLSREENRVRMFEQRHGAPARELSWMNGTTIDGTS